MLQIERVSWRQPRYTVRDDNGHGGIWVRRRFGEAMTGEIDGDPFELRREGRRHFALASAGADLATADATKRGKWALSAQGSAYELGRRSAWRSEMELCQGAIGVGSVRKGRRHSVICALPDELTPAVQAFIGFVAITLWSRAAAAAAAAAASS